MNKRTCLSNSPGKIDNYSREEKNFLLFPATNLFRNARVDHSSRNKSIVDRIVWNFALDFINFFDP